MKILCIITLLALSVTALWPIPQHYTHGNSVLWLPADVNFYIQPSLKSTAQVPSYLKVVRAVKWVAPSKINPWLD